MIEYYNQLWQSVKLCQSVGTQKRYFESFWLASVFLEIWF